MCWGGFIRARVFVQVRRWSDRDCRLSVVHGGFRHRIHGQHRYGLMLARSGPWLHSPAIPFLVRWPIRATVAAAEGSSGGVIEIAGSASCTVNCATGYTASIATAACSFETVVQTCVLSPGGDCCCRFAGVSPLFARHKYTLTTRVRLSHRPC